MFLLSLSVATAADVSFAGSDTDGGNAWRTAADAKPLDADGDDVYGTDGYIARGAGQLFQVLPTGVSVTIHGQNYDGDSRQSVIDRPDGGTMNAGMISQSVTHFATYTFNEPTRLRVGVFTDNYEFMTGRTNAPSSLTMSRIDGGSAGTADPIDDSVLEQTDGHFFDLSGEPGDVFHLTAPGPFFGNELAFMTFDALPPTMAEAGVDAARTSYDTLVGGDPVDRSGPTRLRPDALTDLVDDLVSTLEAEGCLVSNASPIGGAHASSTALGETDEGEISGAFSRGAFAVDSPWTASGRHTRRGKMVGMRADGGFVAGRWVRVAGTNGLWMGLTGDSCDDPTVDIHPILAAWRTAP